MLGGGVIKIISSCLIDYFGPSSTLFENFDWTNTVSFFSWSFLPWWPKSTKSHDLIFENSITGATGARKSFVHVNLPKPISVWSNRISFKEWGLFLTMPPPTKYFWALRRAVGCQRYITVFYLWLPHVLLLLDDRKGVGPGGAWQWWGWGADKWWRKEPFWANFLAKEFTTVSPPRSL